MSGGRRRGHIDPKLRQAILAHPGRRERVTAGALQGDDIQLEYDEKGYPELPERLDRRPATKEAA